jgi:GDPmannose 4,6-dehydratase
MPAHNAPPNGKRALITGITGQDGSYLAELLLSKGYEVTGMVRRASTINRGRIDHLSQEGLDSNARLRLVYGDLGDGSALHRLIESTRPDEIYNLGAQSHVRVSFDIPEYTSDITGLGCVRLLEAIRGVELPCRFYQASSSEQYGKALETPQNERTPFNPRSPYAIAKTLAFYATQNYREAYGMFAVNGILFNHESPRRGETFVTRKITRGIAAIVHGKRKRLLLGNLDARRDWGFAGDYVQAMWLMMQADKPDDYVIATGETHSVREFCEAAFAHVDLPLHWVGSKLEEKGVGADGRVLVELDPRYFRPTDVDSIQGDAAKARRELGWKPTVNFQQLVKMMVEADMAAMAE